MGCCNAVGCRMLRRSRHQPGYGGIKSYSRKNENEITSKKAKEEDEKRN